MIKKIIAILLLIAMLPAMLLYVGVSLPEYYDESYYAELSEMYEKLKTTEGRKIVIVGGSNIAFGVDSELLEELLVQCGYEYTVCNFGLYAAVGTSAMLELSMEHLHEGDIVVFAIEPTSETHSTYFGATAFWKCAESNPEMLLELNKDQKSAMVGNYLSYLQERIEIFRTGILPDVQGVYAKASFDGNCNMTYDRAGNAMALGYDTANPIDLSGVAFEEAFCSQVAEFVSCAKKRGATVLMSFSPMNCNAMASTDGQVVYDFFLRCGEAFGVRMISDPNDYIMDSGWFYDSNFHLNSAGAEVRTVQLANDLLNHMGYFRELEYELPQMPASIAKIETTDTDMDDFLFEPVGENGYLVSGLTEHGAGKATLVLPSAHNGKPVVGFVADAFAENRTLTELTLPASIESIPDGAFRGCVNLTRLNLLHTDTPPGVGDGLLLGVDNLTVYVPIEAYHLYRDGAGCASNPWEQYKNIITAYET